MPTIDESIQVWVVRLAGQSPELWRPLLTESEWERAMRFRLPADQVRSAVTRGVLRTLLARYLTAPPAAIKFTYNEFGKPALLTGEIGFSVSHSGDVALLAFSGKADVGVDIEQIKGQRVVSDLAQRVLTAVEYKRFVAMPEADRERTFFQIWALKESVMKALGTGMSLAPEFIELDFYPATARVLTGGEVALQCLEIGDPGYAAAVAIVGKDLRPIEIRHFEAHKPDSTF
jgi:4'-phosphopantetheinyl transferase